MNRLIASFLVLFVLACFLAEGESWWASRRRRRRYVPPPPPRINCAVSSWGSWSSCSRSCYPGGTRYRTRYITRYPKNGGSGCPGLTWTTGCNSQACPKYNCYWGKWGGWSSCSKCSASARSRLRNVTQAAMFGGATCPGHEYMTASCPHTASCTTSCPAGFFKCRDGLTCVKSTLRCNGDDDCSDNSDEMNCPKIFSPCGSSKHGVIPNIYLAGAGYDITTGKMAGKILDNHQYNGRCVKVVSGDHNQIYRQPANIQYYRFQVSVDSTFTTKAYSSAKDYVEDQRKAMSTKVSASVSYGTAFFSASVSSSYTGSKSTKQVVQQASNNDAQFFTVTSEIKLAQFRTVRGNYILSHNFRRRLRDLPSHYDFMKYLQVIADYGTHFYSSGVLGGKYDYTYRYSKNELRSSGLSESDQKHCLSLEASARYMGVSASASTSGCSSNSLSKKHGSSFTKSASEVISKVVGGSSSAAASLTFGKNPDSSKYDAWVKTVKANPTMIDFQLTPISAVIPDSAKRRNMQQALYHYMSKYDYNTCKGTCYNGAGKIITNAGKTCTCLCKSPYTGQDCHNR